MTKFVVRRAIYGVLVMVGVLFVANTLLLASGDPARALLPLDATPAQLAQMRSDLGLDDPRPVQFVKFLGRAAQGDFGTSQNYDRPALDVVAERLPATLELGLVALALALVIGLPLGAVAALRKGSWLDHVSRLVAAFGQAIPGFWVGLMLLLVFGERLRWLPTSGRGGLTHLILPGLTIALPVIPVVLRIFRSSLLGVLNRDYVRTARAKGLGAERVFRKHVLRNSSLPVMTVVGFQVGSIISGALVAEVIFAYPGMGRLAYQAVSSRDLAVVQVFVVFVSAVVIVTNVLIDLSYALLDPRVRVR